MMRFVRCSLIVLVLGLASSCGKPGAMEPEPPESTGPAEEPAPTAVPQDVELRDPGTPAPVLETISSPTPVPTAAEGGSDPGDQIPEALLVVIRRLVAAQQAVPEDEVIVEEIEAVAWPDASLGCPQPGVMYAQVVTPGFRVEVEAAGEAITVHTDAGRQVVVCGEDGQPVVPAIPIDPDEILDGEPWIPVDG